MTPEGHRTAGWMHPTTQRSRLDESGTRTVKLEREGRGLHPERIKKGRNDDDEYLQSCAFSNPKIAERYRKNYVL